MLEQPEGFGNPALTDSASSLENVLHEYVLRVANSRGQSFAMMAAELVDVINHEQVIVAAIKSAIRSLCGHDQALFGAIRDVLKEMGVLEF